MQYSGTPTSDFLNGKAKKVTISLNDSNGIAKALSQIKRVTNGDELNEAVASKMESLCSKGEEFAKFMCPVDTGALRESITHDVTVSKGMVKGVISAGTKAKDGGEDYVMFVEFGTGVRGKGTYPGDDSNWTYDYKNQNWQGQAANPFMFRTAEYLENNAERIIRGE